VLVSPSRRARETCELCGLGELAQTREDLLEWDYGDYEGLTTDEIHARRAGWSVWRDGCPGGESAAQVGARADRVIAGLGSVAGAGRSRPGPRRSIGGSRPGRRWPIFDRSPTVAVFSHGHMLRVLGARWIELAAAEGARLGLATAAISVLGYERNTAILARWNDAGAEPPAT
jgi:broad specificity phosphatase PhoE